MDIFSMQCFLSAAEHLNLSKAAVQMHITQPAMSVQIRKLEQEIGTPLFERDSRKMILTPAGQVVKKSFSSMVGTYSTMLWQVRTLEKEKQCLRIGYHGPSNWAGISGLFPWFLQKNPGIRISIRSGEYGELARRVEEGQLDVAFLEASEYRDYGALRWEALFDDYGCFAMSKDHRLANRTKVGAEDIRDQKIYFNLRESASMQGIFRKLIQFGIAPHNLCCVDGTATSIAQALASGGLAALPMSFKEYENREVAYVDQDSKIVHMQFGLMWRADNETEELGRFIQCCKSYHWPKTTEY